MVFVPSSRSLKSQQEVVTGSNFSLLVFSSEQLIGERATHSTFRDNHSAAVVGKFLSLVI